MIGITLDELQEMEDNYEGLCTKCGSIRPNTEPDAEGYNCEDCGENAVIGTLVLLISRSDLIEG